MEGRRVVYCSGQPRFIAEVKMENQHRCNVDALDVVCLSHVDAKTALYGHNLEFTPTLFLVHLDELLLIVPAQAHSIFFVCFKIRFSRSLGSNN